MSAIAAAMFYGAIGGVLGSVVTLAIVHLRQRRHRRIVLIEPLTLSDERARAAFSYLLKALRGR